MVDIINGIISSVGSAMLMLLNLLPMSPFNYVLNVDSNFIEIMNYLFPFNQVIAILQSYITAVLLYYSIRTILRWVKVASQ